MKGECRVPALQEVPTQSINLSHNHLQEIPHQLSQMADLKLLDIRSVLQPLFPLMILLMTCLLLMFLAFLVST